MRKLYFITSNRVKLIHARHLAQRYNAKIKGKKYYGIAYREPRSLNRTALLQKSFEDAHARWLKTAGSPYDFFFIEDTSVVIHSLSKKKEYPGVDVKYWMEETSFAELDRKLKSRGNDRGVTVRSDVVLHLPETFRTEHGIKERVCQFIGETDGTITESEYSIQTNLLYPWLDNRSFNKWFVPKGCNVPLSSLPIEIADRYDIRKDSIGAMLQYLSAHNVFGDHPELTERPIVKFLPHLFPPLLIVTGLPCAGKTTLGAHLSEQCGYFHIEASDFMRRAFYERHGLSSSLSMEAFAEEALRKTPDIVVSPVLEEIERSSADLIVVTGFRSPKEIEIFKSRYRGPAEIVCWYVRAKQEIRFRRSVDRGRNDAVQTIADFRKRDEVQLGMGLSEICKSIRKETILNEGSISEYLETSRRKLGVRSQQFRWPEIRELCERPTSLEETILIGLAVHGRSAGQALSTTRIAHTLNTIFADVTIRTSKNNVSRYFNFRPHPYYKVTKDKGVVTYSLSSTGLSKALRLITAQRMA